MKTVLLCLLNFYSLSVKSQQIFKLNLIGADESSQNKLLLDAKNWLNKYEFSDSLDMLNSLKLLQLKAIDNGFINISIDSINCANRNCSATVFTGEQINWVQLKKGNVDESFLQRTGINNNFMKKKILSSSQLAFLMKAILKNCENNGYPFAEIKLDSIVLYEDSIEASLKLVKNKFIIIDSIVQRLPLVISNIYLYNYLDIHPGDVYNEQSLQRIANRLKELNFLKEKFPHRIVFTEKATKLELFLEPKRSSQFDGIVGLQPQQDKPGKYNLTGDVHLKLQNSFQRAEVLEFNWKQIPPKSQDLKIYFYYPYLFNTPVGPLFNLHVYKRDTLYLDVTRNIGLQYQFSGNNYINAFVKIKESSLLTTYGLQNISTLPVYADIDNTNYGINAQYEQLDYRFNPTKGFKIFTTISSGTRNIKRNSKINDAVYDSLKLKSIQYHVTLNTENYFTLYKRNVLLVATQLGWQYQEDNTFENEYFRLGGLNSLRGFDEDALFATSYAIGKIEYRYILEQNSYFDLFYNIAWYEKKNKYAAVRDIPLGLGAGMAFETRIGILSLNYALGREKKNPLVFRNAKVHFGILNYF